MEIKILAIGNNLSPSPPGRIVCINTENSEELYYGVGKKTDLKIFKVVSRGSSS